MLIKTLKISLLFLLFSCSLDIPPIEVEMPPIESNTTIVVDLFDTNSSKVEAIEAVDCSFTAMPTYPAGYIAYCEKNCCLWRFPEDKQTCEEKWCLDTKHSCGWSMDSWGCYSN